MASKREAKAQYQHYVPAVKKVPDWYKNFKFVLITSMEELRNAFKGLEDGKYFMGFDTETTGLNFEELELVGYSFCLDGKTAYYVPICHFEYEYNLGEPAVEYIYDRMCHAKMVFLFNMRYDFRVFEFRGYKEKKEELDSKRYMYVKYDMSKVPYYDVCVACWNADTNKKMPSLKWSSEHYLGFEQMHFDEVINEAGNFYYLNPSENPDVTYYAAADALCTYLLVPVTMKYFQEGRIATKADNSVLYPIMHFEEEKIWVDTDKVKSMLNECKEEVESLEQNVYDMLGTAINLNSPIQVAQAFQRIGIDTGEKTESGGMATGMKVLERLPEAVKEQFPALKSYIEYKETYKLMSSYFKVLDKECERTGGYTRFAYQTSNVPTGRLSAGKDAKNTYFTPMNIQAFPKPHVLMYDVFFTGDRNLNVKKDNILLGYKFVPAKYDDNKKHIVPTDSSYVGMAEGMNPKLNVRSCMTPKMYKDSKEDEFVYCAADYAAQELRITANISREPVWSDAFIHGKDVHKSTAIALWGEENYNKDYRKRAKGCFSTEDYFYTNHGAVKGKYLDIVEDELIDLNGNNQRFNFFINKQIGYEIELSNGMIIHTTKDHKFNVIDTFKDGVYVKASDLGIGRGLGLVGISKFGDYQKFVLKKDKKNPEREFVFDESVAYLCGFYLGDECVDSTDTKGNVSVLAKKFNIDYLKNAFSKFGNPSVTEFEGKDYFNVKVSDKGFADFINKEFGSKNNKHVCDIVYCSPKSVMMSFLAGLLDSDGNIDDCTIEYQSTNEGLSRDVSKLVTFLGYTVISFSKTKGILEAKYRKNSNEDYCVDYYTVRIAFEDKIKDIPLKSDRRTRFFENRKRSIIGYSILESDRSSFKYDGSYNVLGNFTDGRSKRLTREMSKKIGDWRYKYIPVTVVRKEEKEIEVVNLECETHKFVCDGLKAPNCNFGIIYGMGASSLVDPSYGIHTLAEAEEFYNHYKNSLPTLFQWIDRTQRAARRRGTTYTYFGRPRRLKGYYDMHNNGFANRTATNTQIQGCHVYDNMVLTNKGYIKIGKLYDEFQRIGQDMSKWNYKVWNGFEWCDFFPVERGKDVKYKLHFDNRQIVECDSRHKVKVIHENSIDWVGVKDLVVGEDNVCFMKNTNETCSRNVLSSVVGNPHPSSSSYRDDIVFDRADIKVMCYIYGVILGDGHIEYGTSGSGKAISNGRSSEVYIVYGVNSKKQVNLKLIKWFLDKKGIHYIDKLNKDHVSKSGTVSPVGTLSFKCYSFTNAMYKITGDLGGNTYTKRLGDKVFTLDRGLVHCVLRGIFDADGNSITGGTKLANEGLVRDIQLLMKYYGYDSLIMKEERKDGKSMYWTVQPHNYEFSYRKEINGEGEYDPNYPKSTLCYHSNLLKDFVPSRNFLNESDYNIFLRVKNGGSCEIRTFRNLYNAMNNIDPSIFMEEDYDYHKIVEVENTGEEVQTYTLCVLNSLHQYVCEGMISKNTAGDMLKLVMIRLWRNLLNNPEYRDDVAFRCTIHDEIQYSVRASRVHEILNLIEKNQTVILKEWTIPIITEASVGWSMGGLFAFQKVEDESKLGFHYEPKLE